MNFRRASKNRTAARLSAATRSATQPLLEALERRRLLSADIHGSNGVVLQSTGRPVALDFDASNHAVLVRYLANSTSVRDPSFGTGGEVDTNLDAITDIARGPGDKIVIVGSRVVARFNADGSIDSSFGNGGQASVTGESITAVAVQSDGKVVVSANAGTPSGAPAVVQRFNTDGTPDTSFASGGTLTIPPPGQANYLTGDVIVETSGKIAIVGDVQQPGAAPASPFVFQITPTGAVDGTTFTIPAVQGSYSAVAQAPDGGLIAVGEDSPTSGQFNTLVVRYLPNGQTAFVADLPGQDFHSLPLLDSVAVTSDNKILVAGAAFNGAGPLHDQSDFYLQRYDLNGNLDANFADGGTGFVSGNGNDSGGYLALLPDNSFYLAGSSSTPPSQTSPTIYSADLFHIGTNGLPVREGSFGTIPPNLPARIEAEGFDVGGEGVGYHDTEPQNLGGQFRPSEGVDIEGTTDTGGGYDVGWTHTGEWLQYTVHNPNAAATTFQLDARVANYGSGGSFHVEVDGQRVTGPIAIPDTGGFQKFTDVITGGIPIAAGDHQVRIVIDGQSQYGFAGNFNWFQLNAQSGYTTQPFTGTPFNVADVVAAVNFDKGGEGVAYHDTEPQNLGGQYRPNEGVDIETETSQGNPQTTVQEPYDVGWTHTGEYLNYTGYFGAGGVYQLAASVANYGSGGSFHVNVDGRNVSGPISIPDTGSFQHFTTVLANNLSIGPGYHVVQFVFDGQSPYGFSGNLSWFQFGLTGSGGGGSTPFGGTAPNLPGATVQAENYDLGGEGVAYHDTTTANQGGAYRTNEGVDVEALPGGGGNFAVDWAHAGEWMKYTVNVTTAGTYSLDAHVSNYGTGGAFHVEVDGQNVTGTLAVPNTGSFTTFTDVLKGGIPLTAGQHVIRFVWDGESQYGFAGNLDWLRFA